MRDPDTDIVVVDVETMPWKEGVQQLLADEPKFEAPANWKDPDKIRAEIARKREKWRDEVFEKAALSPFTGQVFAIAAVSPVGDPVYVSAAEGEESQLHNLRETCDGCHVVTWNGVPFDAPFLVTRYLHHGIAVPSVLQRARRYSSSPFVDLRGVLAGWDRYAEGTLSVWCKFLGIEPPAAKTTAEIRQAQDQGDWQTAAQWALSDAQATARLYLYLYDTAPGLLWGRR